MMYLHEIQYPNITYYIYFSDILTGAELEKMQTDFAMYCPEE